MDDQKIEKEIFDLVSKDHDDFLKLHGDINKDYVGYISNNINQRKDFYKNLVSLCGIILGFTPFFFGGDKIKHENLFFGSIILLLGVIIFIVNYLRAVEDAEGNELSRQLNEYNILLAPQIKKRREFLNKGIFTIESLQIYLQEMKQLSEPTLSLLSERDAQVSEQRKKARMDYAGEFFVYLFVLSVVLLVLSFMEKSLSIYEVISFALILILLVFFFPARCFVYLGYPIEGIKKFFNKKWKNKRIIF